MRRIVSLAAVLLLAVSPSPPHAGRTAYVDVARLVEAQPFYAAVRDYDRQIAALRSASFPSFNVDAGAARREAANAGAHASALAGDAAIHRSEAALMLNPATLDATIRERYAAQAAFIHAHAAGSGEKFRVALQNEQRDATSAFARSLDDRNVQAYAARVQQLSESEANDTLDRERAVESERLELQLQLANLRPDAQTRHVLASRLDAINRSLASAARAERERDEAKLAAYRASLTESAKADFVNQIATLRAQLAANWNVRQQVTDAQLAQPAQLPLMNPPHQVPADASRTAAATASRLRSAGSDISHQLAADTATDEKARAGARREILVLQSERDELYAAIVAQVHRAAERAASARGLRLVDHPVPGAVDITRDVRT